MKQCTVCSTTKPLDLFYKDSRKKDGRRANCKECQSIAEKRYYYRENVETVSRKVSRKNTQLKRLYGISLIDLESVYNTQSGLCAICGKELVLTGDWSDKHKIVCVDHNHITGEVRGLLCGKCNRGLGFFNDSQELLENASTYLEKYNG